MFIAVIFTIFFVALCRQLYEMKAQQCALCHAPKLGHRLEWIAWQWAELCRQSADSDTTSATILDDINNKKKKKQT